MYSVEKKESVLIRRITHSEWMDEVDINVACILSHRLLFVMGKCTNGQYHCSSDNCMTIGR